MEHLVFSCDYNGWADVREEEREAIEAFETGVVEPVQPPVQPVLRVPTRLAAVNLRRKAA